MHSRVVIDQQWRSRLTHIVTAVALLPALAGCSSYFSNSVFGSPNPQQAANVPPAPSVASAPRVQPPPSYTVAEAAPSPPPAMQPYPNQSITDLFKGSTDPIPMGPPSPAGTPMTDSDPAASAYPYPKQSLVDLFKGSTSTPSVPRPPSTYTPSAQPYTPPPGQPGYGAPPSSTAVAPATPTAAAPPPKPDPAMSGSPYPQQSITDLFSNKQQPAQ